jgi:hypothetical protein
MITTTDFEERFQALDFLSTCEQTTDAFNSEYEQLLNDIKAYSGPRLEFALRLKALQIKQGVFLCAMYEGERIKVGSERGWPV